MHHVMCSFCQHQNLKRLCQKKNREINHRIWDFFDTFHFNEGISLKPAQAIFRSAAITSICGANYNSYYILFWFHSIAAWSKHMNRHTSIFIALKNLIWWFATAVKINTQYSLSKLYHINADTNTSQSMFCLCFKIPLKFFWMLFALSLSLHAKNSQQLLICKRFKGINVMNESNWKEEIG